MNKWSHIIIGYDNIQFLLDPDSILKVHIFVLTSNMSSLHF